MPAQSAHRPQSESPEASTHTKLMRLVLCVRLLEAYNQAADLNEGACLIAPIVDRLPGDWRLLNHRCLRLRHSVLLNEMFVFSLQLNACGTSLQVVDDSHTVRGSRRSILDRLQCRLRGS